MADIVSTTKESIKTVFDKINKVFYFADNKTAQGAVKALSALSGGIELPILEGGVNLDTGSLEKSEVKLTDGTIWLSKITNGDSDISFNVATVHSTINELFLDKKVAAVISSAVQIGNYDYTGQGYGPAKKIGGALVFITSDNSAAIYLPDVEMGGALKVSDDDNSAGYYECVVTPLTDANGAMLYIMNGTPHSNG